MTLLKPCIECDTLSDRSLCPEHRPTYTKPERDPYDHQFRKLSELARKLQPFCLWCNTSDDLQLDHTPAAWEAKAAGKPITLAMCRVLCGDCNRLAGQAKPGPGQRTSEERPDLTDKSGPGRFFTPGGSGQLRRGPAPGLTQASNNTPALGPRGRLVATW